MLEQKVSKNEAIFAYDLLQIFNKNATQKDNIVSAIELADKFFEDNYWKTKPLYTIKLNIILYLCYYVITHLDCRIC